MQRTFNYTRRHRIEQTEVRFRVSDNPGAAPDFDVEFQLEDRRYPESARLVVEAYYKETRQRFECGSALTPVQPENRALDRIDLSGRPLFRVLVIDPSSKGALILASGDGFRAISDDEGKTGNVEGLLTVRSHPLGGLPWRLDFEGAKAELLVNSAIPRIMDRMRCDPVFQGLILPAAFREILRRIVFDDSSVDKDEEQYLRWLAVAEKFSSRDSGDLSEEQQDIWLDEVVENFCAKFNFARRIVDYESGKEGK